LSECGEDVCEGRQAIQENGKCGDCPDYTKPMQKEYNFVTKEWRAICTTQCDANERILSNGDCEQCPSGTRLSDDKRACNHVSCEYHQIKGSDGACKDCPAYTRPRTNDAGEEVC